MPRKRDTSDKHLRRLAEVEKDSLAHALGLLNEPYLIGVAYDKAQEFRNTDWDDHKTRAFAAHWALSLDDLDPSLKKAFETFGLDSRNPFNGHVPGGGVTRWSKP